MAEEGESEDQDQTRLPGGESSHIGEWSPRGWVGSSLAQDTGNQTEENSSNPTEGRNLALTKDELDNPGRSLLSAVTSITAI